MENEHDGRGAHRAVRQNSGKPKLGKTNMTTSEEEAERALKLGERFPYDAGADFWEDRSSSPPTAKDKAHAAARGALANLLDRRGIKHVLEDVDHDVRQEITESLAAIIRLATR